MVFSSVTFMFYFLPIILLLYFLAKGQLRNLVLVIGSLFFYAWGEPIFVLLMVFSTIVDYSLGLLVTGAKQRAKWKLAQFYLSCSIFINLSLLIIFKYSGLLPLPIGISFYTFQTMSYTIDVYRGKVKAQTNFLSFATYVTLFPQLIAGPIVRYETIEHELLNRKENLSQGIPLFLIGLAQKVLLANNIGLAFEEFQSGMITMPSTLSAIFLIIAFSLQVYFDFVGYSNMAIGLGLMFGFHFPLNFNKPFLATSISDFWQRWHISLTTWFKEYVYIPLGGNRHGTCRTIRNILIVWGLTGIWHGTSSNYFLWGLYFGLILILEKFILQDVLKRLPNFVSYIYTVFILLMGWVLFAFESYESVWSFYAYLFGANGLYDESFLFLVRNYGIVMLLCLIASTNITRKVMNRINKSPISQSIVYTTLMLLSIAYIVESSYNPFLYFRF
ncbi:MAG: MBOAT family O-acyltransferase [Eubacteriales bacterium]